MGWGVFVRFEIGLVKVVKQQYRVQFSTSRRMTFDKKRIIYRHIIYKFTGRRTQKIPYKR